MLTAKSSCVTPICKPTTVSSCSCVHIWLCFVWIYIQPFLPLIPTHEPYVQSDSEQAATEEVCMWRRHFCKCCYVYISLYCSNHHIISFLTKCRIVLTFYTLPSCDKKKKRSVSISPPCVIYTIPTILPSVITNKNTAVSFHISCKEKNVGVDVSISLYSHTCLWLYIFLYILYSTIMTLFKRTCQGKKKGRSPGQQYGRTWNHKDGLTVAARISLIITTSSPAVTISTTE